MYRYRGIRTTMNDILRYMFIMLLTLFLVMIVMPLALKTAFYIKNSKEKEEELRNEIELKHQEIVNLREGKYQELQEKIKQDEMKRKDEERMEKVKQRFNMRMDARRNAKLRESQKQDMEELEEIDTVKDVEINNQHVITTYEQHPIVHSNYDSILNAIDYTPSN